MSKMIHFENGKMFTAYLFEVSGFNKFVLPMALELAGKFPASSFIFDKVDFTDCVKIQNLIFRLGGGLELVVFTPAEFEKINKGILTDEEISTIKERAAAVLEVWNQNEKKEVF